MHAAGEGSAQHHARAAVEGHPLELRPALLPVAGDLAHSDLVADHLHGLRTLSEAPGWTNHISQYLHSRLLPFRTATEFFP